MEIKSEGHIYKSLKWGFLPKTPDLEKQSLMWIDEPNDMHQLYM